MLSLVVQATAAGRVVRWAEFKQGYLRDGSGIMTTMLTDVVCDVADHCRRYEPSIRFVVLRPNGFFSARFDVLFEGSATRVCCGRRLARGGFPFNPGAAEDPRNYDVIVAATSMDDAFEAALTEMLQSRYVCRVRPVAPEHERYLATLQA